MVFIVFLIEELVKVLFVLIFVLLVVCNLCSWLVVFDFGLFGYVLGMGFVLIEDVDYGWVVGLWDFVFLFLYIFFLLSVMVGFVF